MIPETLASLFGFLGLIAPGLLYQLLREHRRPALEETAFREASHVALTSLVFTTASFVILGGLAAVRPRWFADQNAWLADPGPYLRKNLLLVERTLVLVVVLACALAFLAHLAISAVRRDGRMIGTSLWYQLFKSGVPAGKASWVQVQLSDKTLVWGYVHHFTADSALTDRELSLTGPGLALKRDNGPLVKLDTWDTFAVRGSEIAFLRVQYLAAAGAKDATRRWLSRWRGRP